MGPVQWSCFYLYAIPDIFSRRFESWGVVGWRIEHFKLCFGQQFGLFVNRVAALAAAFGDLALGGEDAIHRAD